MIPAPQFLRRRLRTPIQARTPESSVPFKNQRVSQWSLFSDSEWILSAKHTIHWNRLPQDFPAADPEHFTAFIATVKQLIYLLITEEQLRAATAYQNAAVLKDFAGYLLTRSPRITTFHDVTNAVISEYFDRLSCRPVKSRRHGVDKTKRLSRDSLSRYATKLLRLHYYRNRIGDGLQSFPMALFDYQVKPYVHYQSVTKPIPDEEFQELFAAALDFIDQEAAITIFQLKQFVKRERVVEVNESLNCDRRDDLSRQRELKIAKQIEMALYEFQIPRKNTRFATLSVHTLAQKLKISLAECAGCLLRNVALRSKYRAKRRRCGDNVNWDSGELNTKLRFLHVACFTIIASSTGMRVGEVLALQPGSLIKRKVKDQRLYWLKSTLTKTSPAQSGEPCFWLCGELAAMAIGVLEKLHAVLPTAKSSSVRSGLAGCESIFRSYVWDTISLVAQPIISEGVLRENLNFFIGARQLKIKYIHPHQFRRSFARNIIRWTETPIFALQRHFKHWTLLMTDYYVGTDPQLMEMFFDAQVEASRERFRQILSGECGGPGGLLLQKRLAKMVDMGEVPKSFRGKTRTESIEAVVDEMSRDGLIAYKCGDFTTCLYVQAVAKCGEDGPKEHECHPTECLNSHILLDDVPFYLRKISQNTKAYKQLSQAEQAGPFGLFLLTRIRNDTAAIMPLTNLYKLRLKKLTEHYRSLNSVDASSDHGVALLRQINEESEVLETVLRSYVPSNT